MRIRKDYSNRGRRQPPTNIANSTAADSAKMGAGSGGSTGNTESMIAAEKAMNDRNKRAVVPNAKLDKK